MWGLVYDDESVELSDAQIKQVFRSTAREKLIEAAAIRADDRSMRRFAVSTTTANAINNRDRRPTRKHANIIPSHMF